MKYFSLFGFVLFGFLFFTVPTFAQITVTTDHADGNYSVGESVHFQIHSTVSATGTYTINRGKYTDAILTGTVPLTAGVTSVITVPGSEPENLHFTISTGWAGGMATAMVGADDLVPFETEPADFDAFWNGVKAELAAVPMNPQVVPYNQTGYSKSYTVSLGNIDGRHVYGMLTVPNGPGPFPVVLEMPAYGSFPISPETQFAERANAITLSITIHNAPATTTDPNAYSPNDPSDRNTIYHKHSVTAGIRALDYLTSRPDFNGTDVAISGVSQGAGLGLLIAGIDSRVKLLTIGTPTMASHPGLLHNHPSGFPYYLRIPIENNDPQEIAAVLQATKYYEAASAAKRFKGNVFLLTSYNDQVTIPETQFIASNFFEGKKVILHNIPGGHDNRPTEYLFGRFEYLRRFFPDSNNPPFPWSSTQKGYMADAGPDKTATAGVPLSLTGSIIDNNENTNPNIPVAWRKISGPGTVTFSSAQAYNTNATFSTNGTYVLEFRGKDTGLLASKKLFYTISDRVVITVGGGGGDPAPTVVLSTPSTSVNAPFVVTANFSESVSGLNLSDFVVTNGSLSNFSGSGSTYTFTVNPANVGAVTVQLPSGQAMDSANQGNLASNLLTVQYAVSQGQDIDLSLSLTSDVTTAPLYSPVNFTLTLTNSGPSVAHNIQVKARLPQGYGLLSSVASAGLYNSWLGDWTLDQLAVGASATVKITAKINVPTPPAFFAQVTAAQEQDVDSTPNNNAGTVPNEDDETAVTVTAGNGGHTNPTVVLSTPSMTVSGAFAVKAKFSESVTGLTASDFVVVNATATSLNGSGDTYFVNINPNGTNVSVILPANTVVSGSNMGNEASNMLQVTYKPGGDSDNYCEPYATPWNEWIARVQYGSINQSSMKDGYADFTSQSTDVDKGSNQNMTITLGHGYWIYNQYYSVWIDFNQDNDFDDAGELVLYKHVAPVPNGTNPNPVVGNIQIPSQAMTGPTRMRVSLRRTSQAGPCDKSGFGEYEDYTVNIRGGITPPSSEYCASASTPWNDWIARVQVGSINQSSGKEGYADFTGLVTDLPKGASSEMTIHLGHGWWIYDEYYRVWIDLNHDGDFEDAGELLFNQAVPSIGNGHNPQPVVAQLNIPDSALTGQTRMRVSLHRDGFGESCNQGGFGEVEDYSINIVSDNGTGNSDYCASEATPWNDWIRRVKIRSLDHYSQKEGYGDFTSLSTPLETNQSLNFTIELGHGWWIYDETYFIWIDLNHDGDFEDTGELLFRTLEPAVPNGVNPPDLQGSIVIPASATSGPTRMRISMRRGQNMSVSPCAQGGFGETEDYTVNILPSNNGLVQQNDVLEFAAQKYEPRVKVSWAVAQPYDMDYFVVERSTDGLFVPIGQLEYKSDYNLFDFWDSHPEGGLNYYRLKVVKKDGSFEFSENVGVEINTIANADVRLFPTITDGDFKIDLADYQGLAAKIDMIDATGRVIRHWDYDSLGDQLLEFNEFDLKQGLYYISIRVEDKQPIVEKVMIK